METNKITLIAEPMEDFSIESNLKSLELLNRQVAQYDLLIDLIQADIIDGKDGIVWSNRIKENKITMRHQK